MVRFHPSIGRRNTASTPEAAAQNVVDLLQADRSITDFLCNASDDPPTFDVERVFEISDWPDCARLRKGLAWLPEASSRSSKDRRRKRSSHRMQPTTDRSDAPLSSMKTRPLQFTLALASGG